MNDIYRKIDQFVESQREAIVDNLMRIACINSVAEQRKDGYPFGEGVHHCLLAVKHLFQKYGFPMEYDPENGYALLKISGETGKTMGLFAHADVVPVDYDDWMITKPFEPVIVENQVVGRGVDDNKSGIIGTLYGLLALKAAKVFPQNGLTVYIGGCEESGMDDINQFLTNEAMPDISLVPDYQFPYGKSEKGIVRIDCESCEEFHDIFDFFGGDAYNVVLPTVTVKLRYTEALYEELRNLGLDVKKQDGMILYVQQGVSGHAAKPEGTESAAYRAAVILCGLNTLCDQDKKILRCMTETLYDCYGEGLGISGSDELGKITIANGIVSVQARKLKFCLDIRYGPNFNGEALLECINRHIGEYHFYATAKSISDGFVLEVDEKVSKGLIQACVSFAGEGKSTPVDTIGGTYARQLKNAYSIGTGLYYNVEKLGLPQGHGAAHQSDECIDIDGFIAGIKIISAMIYEVDRAIL